MHTHLHVEAGVEALLAGVVEALDAVRLRVVRHQLRVLLDHQQEASLALDRGKNSEVSRGYRHIAKEYTRIKVRVGQSVRDHFETLGPQVGHLISVS